MKKSISERALLARLNRKLRDDGLEIRTCRADSRAFLEVGRFYAVSTRHNAIALKDIDLVDLAREHGCIKAFEELEVRS